PRRVAAGEALGEQFAQRQPEGPRDGLARLAERLFARRAGGARVVAAAAGGGPRRFGAAAEVAQVLERGGQQVGERPGEVARGGEGEPDEVDGVERAAPQAEQRPARGLVDEVGGEQAVEG